MSNTVHFTVLYCSYKFRTRTLDGLHGYKTGSILFVA